jgi:tRNA(Ile)-lysidine synthase
MPGSENPYTIGEFIEQMASFEPFELNPKVAVAVSGGGDSMSLALLAHEWANSCGGSLVALTVDHGLRAESANEAAQVKNWLYNYNIPQITLKWRGPYPSSGLQAAARKARYQLMMDYCSQNEILHLLIGHHREDQAETVMIRNESNSGPHGLAGMASVRELPEIRLLRPLLDLSRSRLIHTLTNIGQSWIKDPSNENIKMARARLRLKGGFLTHVEAMKISDINAKKRVSDENATSYLSARALRFHPEGFITLYRNVIRSEDNEVVERLLSRIIMSVAGRQYPPRSMKIRRLLDLIISNNNVKGYTLGGCRLLMKKDLIYVFREESGVGPSIQLTAGVRLLWDNRFSVLLKKNQSIATNVGPLTALGWNKLIKLNKNLKKISIPYEARIVLPAIWGDDDLLAVPHIEYYNSDIIGLSSELEIKWMPRVAVGPVRFGLGKF